MSDQGEFPFVPSTELVSRIEDQLSNYVQQGILDSGLFYEQIRFCIHSLGLSMFAIEEAIVKLKDHKTNLPCDFYMLESAWLCDKNGTDSTVSGFFRNEYTYFEEKTTERMLVPVCGVNYDAPCLSKLSFDAQLRGEFNGTIVDRITIKDKIETKDNGLYYYNRPVLLRLNSPSNSLRSAVCKSDCKNLFAHSADEISISKDRNNYVLYSTLKHPVIFIRYYKFPIEEETGLPMIPDDPILQRAIEYYLMHYFFNIAWLNNSAEGLENRVKSLRQDRDLYMAQARAYVSLPTFNAMVDFAKRQRTRFSTYERIYNNNGWR